MEVCGGAPGAARGEQRHRQLLRQNRSLLLFFSLIELLRAGEGQQVRRPDHLSDAGGEASGGVDPWRVVTDDARPSVGESAVHTTPTAADFFKKLFAE